jgi:hypothetical protein
MQGSAKDLSYFRRICDEFRATGSLESRDGRDGFRSKIFIDFLTCENGFSSSVGTKYAASRADAVKNICKSLMRFDFIHHYRDALDFEDDDGFFRFLDDEPERYFRERQTALSFKSPLRPARAGEVLWSCDDILLGGELEVWNKAFDDMLNSILYQY